ncbi:sulfite exporter TauE/SafE family protein [Citricoccus sp. SGAir0253]|uniref:sulfite exporter TauE/SafE family protein n=1 Tax=Citricoccus sp. SGAir0253 TaxID=2567881 RepID=UPI0010CD6190|nr:sulfite exporter TauE/SafE family protein [Citricoccus sp. SGAir0253]QCU77026.1 sulfite exporter TauE/SafE family protein [Citricoccus sp. SGAir0253]
MTVTLIVTLALSVLIGVSLGLLGGGGSILTVPILTYVAGLPAKEAIAASLFVVGTTSVVSVISHARKGRVKWRTGLVFGGASMAGAFGGGLLGGHVPGTILMIAFALMMVATAAAMIRGRKKSAAPGEDGDGARKLPVVKVILEGLVVGLVTGLVGAGGGFLVVPALVLLGGLSMPAAVGTSLVVIAMKSFAGLGGYLTSVQLDWGLVAGVTVAAILGSLVGARLTGIIPEAALREGFGFFVLAMGVFVLVQELPSPAGPIVGVVGGAAVAAVLLCRYVVRSCPMHRARQRTPVLESV